MSEKRFDSYRMIHHPDETLTRRIYRNIITLPERVVGTVYEFFGAGGREEEARKSVEDKANSHL